MSRLRSRVRSFASHHKLLLILLAAGVSFQVLTFCAEALAR